MSLRSAIPSFVKHERARWVAQRVFPHANIDSHRVSSAARLGIGVRIGQEVVVNAGVTIGDFTYANRGALLFSGVVGRYCSIAAYTTIGGHLHPTDYLSTSPMIYGRNNLTGATPTFDDFPSPPSIGSDVWIGANAVVAQGVAIGHGAIVGAGAVVTRDVEPYTIVTGAPAKAKRQRFNDATVARLLELEWWTWDVTRLRDLRAAVEAGSDFAEHLP